MREIFESASESVIEVREVFERVSETARETIEMVSWRRVVFVVTQSLYIMDSLSYCVLPGGIWWHWSWWTIVSGGREALERVYESAREAIENVLVCDCIGRRVVLKLPRLWLLMPVCHGGIQRGYNSLLGGILWHRLCWMIVSSGHVNDEVEVVGESLENVLVESSRKNV